MVNTSSGSLAIFGWLRNLFARFSFTAKGYNKKRCRLSPIEILRRVRSFLMLSTGNGLLLPCCWLNQGYADSGLLEFSVDEVAKGISGGEYAGRHT